MCNLLRPAVPPLGADAGIPTDLSDVTTKHR